MVIFRWGFSIPTSYPCRQRTCGMFALWAGSYGGTLTPSFTLGAGLGFLLTSCLEIFGLSLNPTLGMLLGATVF